MLKILALHGYTNNGEQLRKKMSAIRKHCNGVCEFYFADGPMILAPVDTQGSEAETTTAQVAQTAPELVPRAWWRSNAEKTVYAGVEESVRYVREVMLKEQFDGVFGFSQGAAFAALLCAMLERPDLYPEILVDGKPPQPPFKFGIFVSGFKPLDLRLSQLFSPNVEKVATPTLHVLGKNDFIVVEERSLSMIEACQNPRVERHDGGHFVPSAAPWRNFFRDYIRSFDSDSTTAPDEVVSPTPRSITPAL